LFQDRRCKNIRETGAKARAQGIKFLAKLAHLELNIGYSIVSGSPISKWQLDWGKWSKGSIGRPEGSAQSHSARSIFMVLHSFIFQNI